MPFDPSVSVAFSASLEKCINFALKYDPATRLKLQLIEDKCLKAEISSPELALLFYVAQDQVHVNAISEAEPDVVVSGQLIDFLSVLNNSEHSFADLNLKVSGQIAVLNHLQDILSQLDIDWEEPLNELIGVVPGHAIAESLRNSWQWLNRQKNEIEKIIPEFLSEELRAIPSEAELTRLYDDVDRIKSDTNRLEARIKRLSNTHSSISNSKND